MTATTQSDCVLLSTSVAELELRELGAKDAESLHQLIQRNRAHLTRLGDYTDMIELSADQLRGQLEADSSQRQFGLNLHSALVGTVTLIKYQPTVFGLGYWIADSSARHGYMTEAVRAVIDFAIRDCDASEIWAGITPTNEPSIRLVQRLGFRLARTQQTHLSYQLLVGTAPPVF